VPAWLAFVAVSFLAALPGAFWPPGAWYESLSKPPWTPPDWVFGPVWSTLYVLMGTAAWMVWRKRGPLTPFFVQLALNAAWTPLFFGLHAMLLAFVCIVALGGAIVATMAAFRRVDGRAGALLAPYLLWVSLAGALNFELWRLNS